MSHRRRINGAQKLIPWKRFSPFIALCVLTVGVYWKLAVGESYVWFDHYDMCQVEIPRLQFLARNLHEGYLPLWDPHLWLGQPVLGAGQPGPLYPLNLLMLSLPLNNGRLRIVVLNYWFLAIHLLAATFMYLLCRDHSLGRIASVLGAVSFSHLGFFGSVAWLDVANGASWTPLVFLFAGRVWSGDDTARNAAWLGLILGMSWLSGHHEIPMINSYAVLLGSITLCVVRSLRSRRFESQLIAATALALMLGAALSAIQTVPMYEFGRLARRWVGVPEPIGWDDEVPYQVHSSLSLSWLGLLGFFIPSETSEHQTMAFVGLATSVLAFGGVWYTWRLVRARRIIFVAGFGVLYALGASTPFHKLLYVVLPYIDKARAPVRGLYLVTFALSLFAAYGADLYLRRKISFKGILVLSIVIMVIASTGALLNYVPLSTNPLDNEFLAKSCLSAVGMVSLLLWSRLQAHKWRLIAGIGLIALILLEATTVTDERMTLLSSNTTVCAADIFSHEELVKQLSSEKNLGRLDLNRDELLTNFGDLHGFDQLQGFVAAVSHNVGRHEFHTRRTQDLFGVGYYIGKTSPVQNDVTLVEYEDDLRLFRREPSPTRAWISHEVVQVATDGDLRRAIQNSDFNLRNTALMLAPASAPRLEQCSGNENVTWSRPNSDTVILTAELKCRGLVILSDAFYPGWRASSNGEPLEIVEVYGALRGVVAESGRHEIVMRYQPNSVRIGASLSAIGILAFALVQVRLRQRQSHVKAW